MKPLTFSVLVLLAFLLGYFMVFFLPTLLAAYIARQVLEMRPPSSVRCAGDLVRAEQTPESVERMPEWWWN